MISEHNSHLRLVTTYEHCPGSLSYPIAKVLHNQGVRKGKCGSCEGDHFLNHEGRLTTHERPKNLVW